ncbi:MAG: hypothetical protein R3F11_05130 [Verrucomicrobiales bacterium]
MDHHPEDTPLNRFLTFWGVLGVSLVVVILAIVLPRILKKSVPDAPGYAERGATAAEVRAVRYAEANKYEWVDKAAGTVRVPASVTYEAAVKDLAAKKAVKSSIPIPGTDAAAAAAAATPAPESTPAPQGDAADPPASDAKPKSGSEGDAPAPEAPQN